MLNFLPPKDLGVQIFDGSVGNACSIKVVMLVGMYLFISPMFSQELSPSPFGDSILWKGLHPHLTILCADSLEGREAGTIGEIRAATYLERTFESMGLIPPVLTEEGDSSFRQEILIESRKIQNGWLKGKGKRWDHLQDIVFWAGSTKGRKLSLTVCYLGSGNEAAYKDQRIKGKLVLIQCKISEIPERVLLAKEKGAAGCLVVTAASQESFDGQLRMFALRSRNPEYRLSSTQTALRNFPVVAIPPDIAAKILNISVGKWHKGDISPKKDGLKIQLFIEQDKIKVPAYNILAYIPGSERPEEVIVLSAHYDHLGMRRGKIHPGADDNAAGVSALLEIARAFKRAEAAGYRPRRSLLFFACTAEEKGLLGSRYYSKHPVFPLEQTLANLNMDMIGHVDDDHQDTPRFVSIVGSNWLSSELHAIHEQANSLFVQLELDYTYNSKKHPERFYYRSDQYNFARHGIPVIFYTSGDHEDYHQPSDIVKHLSKDRLEGVARLIFYTAWELAFREQAISVDLDP
ncbi:MAG: M28 family peptidase [Bacteroidota bacterium]